MSKSCPKMSKICLESIPMNNRSCTLNTHVLEEYSLYYLSVMFLPRSIALKILKLSCPSCRKDGKECYRACLPNCGKNLKN